MRRFGRHSCESRRFCFSGPYQEVRHDLEIELLADVAELEGAPKPELSGRLVGVKPDQERLKTAIKVSD